MKKKLIIIFSVFLFLLIIGGSIGYYLYQKPVKDFSKSKADVALDAKTLFDEFIKDENASTAKYVSSDKTIQVAGTVSDIKNNDDDSTVTVILDIPDSEGDVSCTLNKDEIPKTAKYSKGDQIIIKGQCSGFENLIDSEVIMIRCGIVEKN